MNLKNNTNNISENNNKLSKESNNQEEEDRYLRLLADVKNMKQRFEKEQQQFIDLANLSLITDLIPILDNIKLGLNTENNQLNDIKKYEEIINGFKMIFNQMEKILIKNGLKLINPKGMHFDPNFHESIGKKHSQDIPENNIIEVIRVGYLFKNKLIRPASVLISSGQE